VHREECLQGSNRATVKERCKKACGLDAMAGVGSHNPGIRERAESAAVALARSCPRPLAKTDPRPEDDWLVGTADSMQRAMRYPPRRRRALRVRTAVLEDWAAIYRRASTFGGARG